MPCSAIPLSLYIHFPWCAQKCLYCDFNSHALKTPLPEKRYIAALLADLDHDLDQFQETRPLQNIFLGGGTPSLFSADAIQALLAGIKQRLAFADGIEITLEANPGSVESAKFSAYRDAGINRLSIGVQSFQDAHLHRLGRIHSAFEAIRAAEIAHRAGFDNFNLDLMFGLPNQTIDEARADIRQAINLHPAHISFYQLTIEPNTYFAKFPPSLPRDELIFAMQQECQQLLAEHGFQQYEISAYARPDCNSKHNENYWRFGDYLGIGAGAHGKISRALPENIVRYWKQKSPGPYMQTTGSTQNYGERYCIPSEDLPLEFVMNQLRLRQGFDLTSFNARTGLSAQKLQPGLTLSLQQNLLLQINGQIRCTEQGWNFLDTVLQNFIPG